jgi:hypothetical protein
VNRKKFPRKFVKALGRVLYHVLLVAVSAGVAFSLPYLLGFFARIFRAYWSLVENSDIYVIPLEIALALLLVLFFNYLGKSWRDRRFAKMAQSAGIVQLFSKSQFLAQRKIRKLKKKQGFARDVMIIASTGFRTFVDPRGDLHSVLHNCREAKIMLLNPYGEGAIARARSILDPDVTVEHFGEQIKKSLEFLRGLKVNQKNIKLKLYQDPPFLKLAILGDYAWMKHYHPGQDIQTLPEFAFEHAQNPGSLYTPFYQYFLTRWENADIPEYDFDTDELVYREVPGKEISREKFDPAETFDGRRDAARDTYRGSLATH